MAAAAGAAAVAGYEQGHIDLPKAGRGYYIEGEMLVIKCQTACM